MLSPTAREVEGPGGERLRLAHGRRREIAVVAVATARQVAHDAEDAVAALGFGRGKGALVDRNGRGARASFDEGWRRGRKFA